MVTKIRNIRANKLPTDLQKKFKLESHQLINITVEVINNKKEKERSLGEDLIEAFKEVLEHKKGKKKLKSASDFFKSF